MRLTAAQRSVLEAMARGETLHYSGWRSGSYWIGDDRVLSATVARLRTSRLIVVESTGRGGAAEYAISPAGREALRSAR